MLSYHGDRRKRYGTTRGQVVFKPNGAPLFPNRSQRIVNHSPDGFEWGYGGSGPAQLALAILFDRTGDRNLSIALYHRFKDDHVRTWLDKWSITVEELDAWIAENKERKLL